MNYTVVRDGKEYGPYSHAELVRYVASGNVLETDIARGDDGSEAVPVGRIIGKIPNVAPTFGNVSTIYPDPPNLHWGLVLLFTVLTCGLFLVVWDIVQAAWAKKVAPRSNAIYYYIAEVVVFVLLIGAAARAGIYERNDPAVLFMRVALSVLSLIGRFSLRNTLEEHFNTAEPAGLGLSGVMTFFFGGIYFQYHLNDIVRRKHAGFLSTTFP